MPQPLRKTDYYGRNYHAETYNIPGGVYTYPNIRSPQSRPNIQERPVANRRPKTKINPLLLLIKGIVWLLFLSVLVYYVFPYNFVTYFEPMLLNRVLNKNITFDTKRYVHPTLKYFSNTNLEGERIFTPLRHSQKQMVSLTPSSRMHSLENELIALAAKYPKIEPSVYVWDYTNSRSAEINADKLFPSASIIKLPILIELFRKSESLKAAGYGSIDLNSKLLFDELHRTSGSGYLQYNKAGGYYTIDYLAKIMIQSSDNSATNMLLEEIGGMDALNAAARKWGLPSTKMSNWLPDLKGTNTISAADMATLLYNIDNPKFLNEHSRYMIKKYMSNVHNNTLLHAGLPKEAEIMHKTGDIGTMLGDAGIIYAPHGKKYIAVILTKRPFNDYSARDFIQKASALIYKGVVENPAVY